MKLSLAAALLVAAPLATHAAECSPQQQAAANVLGQDADFEKACSDVFNADPKNSAPLVTLNATTLAQLAPCKQPSCATYLKSKIEKIPDCEISGVNARLVFKTIADYCGNETVRPKDLGSGASVENGKLVGSSSASSASSAGSSSSSGSASAGVVIVTKDKTTPNKQGATTVGDSDNDAKKKNEEKVTNANTKSDANSAIYAGATAIVAGALLSVLIM